MAEEPRQLPERVPAKGLTTLEGEFDAEAAYYPGSQLRVRLAVAGQKPLHP